MREARTARAWIWAAVAVQLGGFAFDALWHGLLHPGVESTTFTDILTHLITVHLPLYLGVLGVLVTTAWSFFEGRRGAGVAFAGALVATLGEASHAVIHLMLSTRGAVIAEGIALIGFLVVVVAVWMGGRRERRRSASAKGVSRAA